MNMLQACLLLSSALFCFGLVTALSRSNTILVLLGIEIIPAKAVVPAKPAAKRKAAKKTAPTKKPTKKATPKRK